MKGRLRPWYFLVSLLCVGFALTLRDDELSFAQSQRGDAVKEAPIETVPTFKPLDKESALRSGDEEQRNTAASDKTRVTGLRFLSSPAYTRIMLDLSQETKYEVRQLREDTAKGTPARIYIDINGARLALASKEPVAVEDGLLKQIRIGQYSADIVRVVLDMHSLRAHNAFILPDPYRLVLDLQGQKTADSRSVKETPVRRVPVGRKPEVKEKVSGSGAAINGRIRKIVLDPGHGGKDPGAIGVGGRAEKDIVLSIAKRLAVRLKNEMGIQVVLTRKDDRYVPLEDRTAIANAEEADLFISLHMNASVNSDAKGIETYYLDNTTDEAAQRLAARENGTSRRNVSDVQLILSGLMQNMKLEDSITLAHRLQSSAVEGMGKVISDVKDLGVKKALFYVLVGAHMPSVLVEMFFITHPNEGRSMGQESAQEAMVEALMQGIQKYAQSNLVARTL